MSFLAKESEGYFTTVAMVNAYFSVLEHLLVLMLPFAAYDPANDNVVDFIGLNWGGKYKRVLPPADDVAAAQFYERLRDIAERFRNTHVHGGFSKNHGGLAVHCAGGALVADVTQRRGKLYFELIPVAEDDFESICKTFDEFEQWLSDKYGGPFRTIC